jgi:hypothetical protein
MEHWSIVEDPVSDGGRRTFSTVQLEVRKKQCLPKSQYIPMFFGHGFSNTPLLQYSNTSAKR